MSARDFAFSDVMMPHVIRAIATELQTDAPSIEDKRRATDLIVRAGSWRVAVRVRRYNCLRWQDEFTIRTYSRGHRTEVHKLLDGWGDYMFYGFANKHATGLHSYRMGDLRVLNEWLPWAAAFGLLEGAREKDNGDGTRFVPIKWDEVPGFECGGSSFYKSVCQRAKPRQMELLGV